MIRITSVTKRYGATLALDGLNLDIPDGSGATGIVFGLLGPNASGKSTLIKLLMGFIFPDRGRIDLGGLQGGELAHRVGTSLRQAGLSAVAATRIQACSKGMLQRVALAQAIVDDPPMLLLDEPMGGLDPAGQKEMRDLIGALAHAGKTILFSTHRLEQVNELCSHIAILSRGKLVRSGALAQVLPPRARVVIVVDRLPDPVPARLAGMHPEVAVQCNTVTLTGAAVGFKPEVLRLLLDANCDIRQVSQGRATMEEIYLEAIRS